METGYLLALTTGFLGGFGHCIGMCGPLVASFSLEGGPGRAARAHPVRQFLYNTGRVTTYVAVGAVMGLTGSFINVAGAIAGIQNLVAVGAGFFIILTGLHIAGVPGGLAIPEKQPSFFAAAVRVVLRRESALRHYLLGLLLGLLPCGLSYSVLLAAAGTGGWDSGMLTMLCFGLGTFPALFLFGLMISFVGDSLRGWIYRASGVTLVLMGLLFLWRGFHGIR